MKLICIGDSITRGQVSADYVTMLRARLPEAAVLNSGVNYELSAQTLDRLDDVIRQDPDVVTVLIGTNDANFTLSPRLARTLRKRWGLTAAPDVEGYAANLTAIARRLQDETMARVGLLSLPVIGEELGSEPVRRAAEYSAIVREVAAEQGVSYLPLNERMTAYLEERGRTPGTRYRPEGRLAQTAAIQHLLLGRGLDAISRSRGLQLTTDTVHLNGRGAAMVADLVEAFAARSIAPH
ncbi:SGNH/GDSL hydrolase family protein [Nonomuraea zeae]|uniref:SGNH/GDSL hydrolase family protein n=1 Tax=Nonomuraea zeae TaxID=1642303 RepID=UPI0014781C6A|nr:SGNH/GDSL hydrolase family protein [Nonomuraea zeae]